MAKLKIFSFFSGSGFLDLGFETNGFDVEFVNEFHPAFMNAYKYSREKMGLRKPAYGYFNGDINDFLSDRKDELKAWIDDARKDGSLVGFIGGSPCPDFSVAGKNRGREGDNGKLSLSYTNLIIEMQPDFFLFENVKGLWKTARHRAFFEELKASIQAAGFVTTNRLTNALEYGAPQDRDRILMFGVQEHLIEGGDLSDFPWDKYRKYNLDDVKALPWPETEAFSENSKTTCPTGIPVEMTVQYWFEKNDVANHPNKEVPNMAISEIPMQTVTYDNLLIPTDYIMSNGMQIEVVRRHTQIQIALYLIGLQLGYRTWIAQNDKGIIYKDKPLLEQPGIVPSLGNENIISAFPGAEPSAKFIDCIWFQNHRFMPAVMEVEHSTGVTSGLTRMKGLYDTLPPMQTRYVIVAPDDLREKAIEEANRPQFTCLDTRFFSYSAVEELYYICTHRNLHGVTQEFLDCYMEKVCMM